jgi:hypothetical protein
LLLLAGIGFVVFTVATRNGERNEQQAPTTTLYVPSATSPPTTKATRQYSTSDVEYKLAGIDRGTQFPSDSAISPYGQVLDSLRGKCTNSRAELGDMSVGTQEMLADMGDPNSLLDILKMVDSVASTDLVMDCTDIFVILVVG